MHYALTLFRNSGIGIIRPFLRKKARKYSQSTLRGMRAVLGLTLSWATSCNWLEKNPCSRVKLPKKQRRTMRHEDRRKGLVPLRALPNDFAYRSAAAHSETWLSRRDTSSTN